MALLPGAAWVRDLPLFKGHLSDAHVLIQLFGLFHTEDQVDMSPSLPAAQAEAEQQEVTMEEGDTGRMRVSEWRCQEAGRTPLLHLDIRRGFRPIGHIPRDVFGRVKRTLADLADATPADRVAVGMVPSVHDGGLVPAAGRTGERLISHARDAPGCSEHKRRVAVSDSAGRSNDQGSTGDISRRARDAGAVADRPGLSWCVSRDTWHTKRTPLKAAHIHDTRRGLRAGRGAPEHVRVSLDNRRTGSPSSQ